MATFLACGVLMVLGGGAAAAEQPSHLLATGTAAPLFDTVDIDGNPYSFAEELARGPTFLVFWSIF